MIGIGTPISQSRMERVTSVSFLPARAAWSRRWYGSATSVGERCSARFGTMLAAAAHRGQEHDRGGIKDHDQNEPAEQLERHGDDYVGGDQDCRDPADCQSDHDSKVEVSGVDVT